MPIPPMTNLPRPMGGEDKNWPNLLVSTLDQTLRQYVDTFRLMVQHGRTDEIPDPRESYGFWWDDDAKELYIDDGDWNLIGGGGGGGGIGGIISVEDYGAIGDGSTDSTEGIQNAVDAARDQGAIVWFPPGVYIITDAIQLYPGTQLRGKSFVHRNVDWTRDWQQEIPTFASYASVVQRAQGSHGPLFNCDYKDEYGNDSLVIFHGMSFRVGQPRTPEDVVYGSTPRQPVFVETYFENFDRTYHVEPGQGPGPKGLRSVWKMVGNAVGPHCWDGRFTACHFVGGDPIVNGSGMAQTRFLNCRFEWAYSGISLTDAASNNIIVGNGFDVLYNHAINISGRMTSGNIIVGNKFRSGGLDEMTVGKRSFIYIKGGSGRTLISGNRFSRGVSGSGLPGGSNPSPYYIIEFDGASPGSIYFIGNDTIDACQYHSFYCPNSNSSASLYVDVVDIDQGDPGGRYDKFSEAMNHLKHLHTWDCLPVVRVWNDRRLKAHTDAWDCLLISAPNAQRKIYLDRYDMKVENLHFIYLIDGPTEEYFSRRSGLNAAQRAPSLGTWKPGATLINMSPAAGGKVGWVYTSSGWKAFGAIDP